MELTAEERALFRPGQLAYYEGILGLLERELGLRPGMAVLDIGCGSGKLGLLLARRGCRVTLTDISPRALEKARENLRAVESGMLNLFSCDFTAATGRETAFAGGFDLSLSTFSPAVCGRREVEKMSAMTGKGCLLTRFLRREQPLRARIAERLNLPAPDRSEAMEEDCRSLLEAIREAGFSPRTEIVDYAWSDRRTPGEMEAILRQTAGAEEQKQLPEVIRSFCDGQGMLTDTAESRVLRIWWTVNA